MRNSFFVLAALIASGSYSAMGQNVQTNNHGVIVNVLVPGTPTKSDGEVLGEYLDAHPSGSGSSAYVIDMNQLEASSRRNGLGVRYNGTVIYVLKQDVRLHSSLQFDAGDALEWVIPVGTAFRFLSQPGSGGHAEIRMCDMTVQVPAESNGYHHRAEVRHAGYVQMSELHYE